MSVMIFWNFILENQIISTISTISTLALAIIAFINIKKQKQKPIIMRSIEFIKHSSEDRINEIRIKLRITVSGYLPLSIIDYEISPKDCMCNLHDNSNMSIEHNIGHSFELIFCLKTFIDYERFRYIKLKNNYGKSHKVRKKSIHSLKYRDSVDKSNNRRKTVSRLPKSEQDILDNFKS